MRRNPVIILTASALLAGCTAITPTTTRVVTDAYLRPFGSCDELLQYFQARAGEMVGPYGLGGHGYGMAEAGDVATEDSAAGDGAEGGSAGGAGDEHSTTNNQEEGVDEADVVKTDGSVIVTSHTGRVHVVDAGSGEHLSTVRLPAQDASGELLLSGSDLIVLTREGPQWAPASDTMPAYPAERTLVTRVDLSDPAEPVVRGSLRMDGGYRSARMVGDSVRMVMVSDPAGLAFSYPETSSLRAEEEAEQANREVIANSTIEDWVPHLQLLGSDGDRAGQAAQPLLDCEDISRPREHSGLATMSVLTFDITDDGIDPSSSAGLVASGSTVYASTDRLVVATSPWEAWAAGTWEGWSEPVMATDLHSFDISDPEATAYLASGTVDGRLLNQFSLDEEDGVIRVATTTDDRRGGGTTQSSLVVLREDGDELVETGRLDGMGTGEEIHAVRYLSADLAAVVTFRQVDPLYLVDTSDPADPTMLGELKIPGYSAYLHPLGDDLLVGVGQDADEETGQTQGLQVSLFDISDPTAPARVSQLSWPDAWSPVEWDHRAFLSWEQTGQVFLPAGSWSEDKDEVFSGVLSVAVDGKTLTEGPRALTDEASQWGEPPMRTLVVGDQLYALDRRGLHRFDLATMEREGMTPLP